MGTFFGLNRTVLDNERGYSDFLFSIAGHRTSDVPAAVMPDLCSAHHGTCVMLADMTPTKRGHHAAGFRVMSG